MRRNFYLCLAGILIITACNKKNEHDTVITFAGSGAIGSANGRAAEASFSNPMGLAVDSGGNVYVADSRNNLIRKISADGMVTTLAGSGKEGTADGKSDSASFFFPVALAAAADGDIYIADTHNSLIRKITPKGTVSTIAGRLAPNVKDQPDSLQQLDNPYGIAVGKDGTIYFTDWAKDLVCKIGRDGRIAAIAGNGNVGAKDGKGNSASFFVPEGIAVDEKNNLYIADTYNNMIRKIDPHGVVTTLAGRTGKKYEGFADGKGSDALFSHPCGIAVDKKGNVYVADVGNNRIRKLTQDGTVTTLAGTGLRGSANGSLHTAAFNRPFGVAVDRDGNVYIKTTWFEK